MASSMKAPVNGSRAAVTGTPVRAVVRAAVPRSRSSVRVQAADSNRRELLAGAAVAAGLAAGPALAGIESIVPADDRKAKYSIDYRDQSLDWDEDIRARRGETQYRQSIEDTKKRVAESKQKLASIVKPTLDKSYWTQSREGLRLQMGYLRYDLNTLAKTPSQKALVKEFNTQIEALDYALRSKDPESAQAEYAKTVALLDNVVSAL